MSTLNIVIGSLERGGAERHLSEVMPMLRKRGYRIRVVLADGLGDFIPIIKTADIEVVTFAQSLPKTRIIRGIIQFVLLFSFFRKHRNEAVHFFLPGSYIFGMIACMAAGQKAIRIMSRRSLNNYQKTVPFSSIIEPFLHKHVNAVLANSQKVCQQLLEEGVTKSQLSLIYNGIDLTRFENAVNIRLSIGCMQDDLIFIIVANLIPYKGHADLIKALAFCSGKIPKWKLLCIGRDNGIQQELESDASAAGIQDNIRWLGSRRDIENLLFSADVGILSSHQEGFSNALLEGMATGIPMIATDVGGNSEAIDESCGILVPPHCPVRLADAIIQLSTNPVLREQMGSAGKQRVKNIFSLKNCVDLYDSFYQKTGIRKVMCAD